MRQHYKCLVFRIFKMLNFIAAKLNWFYSHLFIPLQFEYHVTCAVCTRTGEKELQILKKFTQVISFFF